MRVRKDIKIKEGKNKELRGAEKSTAMVFCPGVSLLIVVY